VTTRQEVSKKPLGVVDERQAATRTAVLAPIMKVRLSFPSLRIISQSLANPMSNARAVYRLSDREHSLQAERAPVWILDVLLLLRLK
jgi:hypothetical protein